VVAHLHHVKVLHERFLARGYGTVELPTAIHRKYPNAESEWSWQYVFPAGCLSKDPRTGTIRRHHIHEATIQRAVRRASFFVSIDKPVGCHTAF
jgi:hypothetical protein